MILGTNVTLCMIQYISGIQGYIRDSVLKYKPRHVKGHQDEWVIMDKLDRLALLNIEVDYWAKDFWAAQVTNHKYFTYTILEILYLLYYRFNNLFLDYKKRNSTTLFFLFNCLM